MPNYTKRVIWSDEDCAWIATVPEFPGISAAGSSDVAALEELGRVLEEAVRLYVESGWTLPQPAAQPLDYSGQLRLRLPRSLHASASHRADDEGVSLNALLLALIARGLGERQATDRACDRLESLLEDAGKIVTGGSNNELQATPAARTKTAGKKYRLPKESIPEGASVVAMRPFLARQSGANVSLGPDDELMSLPEEAIK